MFTARRFKPPNNLRLQYLQKKIWMKKIVSTHNLARLFYDDWSFSVRNNKEVSWGISDEQYFEIKYSAQMMSIAEPLNWNTLRKLWCLMKPTLKIVDWCAIWNHWNYFTSNSHRNVYKQRINKELKIKWPTAYTVGLYKQELLAFHLNITNI